MRIRTIKPEFWEDEVIGSLSIAARLLMLATLNMADDEGLLRWTPAYVKSSAFRYNEGLDVEPLMDELTGSGRILTYSGGYIAQAFAWIPTFHRHQKINRPQTSKLPPPPLTDAGIGRAYADRDEWTCYICNERITPEAPSVPEEGYADLVVTLCHAKPRSEGGNDAPSNIHIAHPACSAEEHLCSFSYPHPHSLNTHGVLSERSLTEGKGMERKGKEGNGKELARPAPRERDLIWEAIVQLYGEPTSSGRGSYNAAAKVLRDFHADPEDIRAFFALCQYGTTAWAVVTPTALAKHYGSRAQLISAGGTVDQAARIIAAADVYDNVYDEVAAQRDTHTPPGNGSTQTGSEGTTS